MRLGRRFRSDGSATVFALDRRIDLATAPALEAEIQHILNAGFWRVTVDMRPVEFIDSSGITALINGRAALQRAGGELSLCGATEGIKVALTSAGLGSNTMDQPCDDRAD